MHRIHANQRPGQRLIHIEVNEIESTDCSTT